LRTFSSGIWRARDLVDGLSHVNGHTDGARLIGE
jgi:hypothetical protein